MHGSIALCMSFVFLAACSGGSQPSEGSGMGAGATSGAGAGTSSGGSSTGNGGSGGGSIVFDVSEYRQNTYGVPNLYCDPTRALSDDGVGTEEDAYNLAQCAQLPVAGDVVGILPSGANSVRLPTTSSDD